MALRASEPNLQVLVNGPRRLIRPTSTAGHRQSVGFCHLLLQLHKVTPAAGDQSGAR